MKIDPWKLRGWTVTFADDEPVFKPKVKKTDKRYTGREHFGYFIDLLALGDEYDFHDMREWCWRTWGASKELDEWLKYNHSHPSWPFAHGDEVKNCQNPHWCWVNDEYRRRIMFHSKEEAALFTLTFGV